MANAGVERVTRWFVKLHGGQVILLWLAWAALWWGVCWLGLATSGMEENVWVALFFTVSFIGFPLLFALTWAWFEARRPAA